ncbi:hypothetical protein R4Z09_27790 [Niallia oryzisoli]|uniref:Uncharacterized protein n=1 Tax=Niallia oryzisoli TaxID=1737571 RepID=A0ABZ2CFA6_9BACI
MVRYIALIFLLLLSSLFYIHAHHHSPINYESPTLMGHESPHDEHDPTTDKYKAISLNTIVTLLLFPYFCTNANPFRIHLIRKKTLFTTIFYQSNYVIFSPLK